MSNPDWFANREGFVALTPDIGDGIVLPKIINEAHNIIADMSLLLDGRLIEFERDVNLLNGVPDTIQKYPAIYTSLKTFERNGDGRLGERRVYEVLIRLVHQVHDTHTAEYDLIHLCDAIPMLFKKNNKLNGLLGTSGRASVSNGEAGWARIGGAMTRIVDFKLSVTWHVCA